MATTQFTLEELLTALGQGPEDLAGYHTVTEWCAMLGSYERRMRALIGQAAGLGILRHTRTQRPAIDGSLRWVNLYAFDLDGRRKEQNHGA